MNEKTDMHIFVWRAMPAIQCARRFFHSYLKGTKNINNQFLNDATSECVMPCIRNDNPLVNSIYKYADMWITCFMPYANNKGADQRSLISTIVVHCLDSMICILAISKVSNSS